MLQLGNKLITVSIETILRQVRAETGGKLFNDIRIRGKNVSVTCPQHKDGQESKPSCYIYNETDGETEYGQVHCFTCDYIASFVTMIGDCFERDAAFGEQWLVERYGNTFVETIELLPEITLKKEPEIASPVVDATILDNYDFYHPYMWKRGLTKEVVDKFRIGFDKTRNAITFPMWDENHNFVGVTARSVVSKRFWIPENLEKPVYLLNVCIFEKFNCIYVCESQINALTLWGYGLPAVALIGTGTAHQYEVLNKCGIRNFITCFDGDNAGRKGDKKFRKNIKRGLVTSVYLPEGKDVNDLTYDEFIMLPYS